MSNSLNRSKTEIVTVIYIDVKCNYCISKYKIKQTSVYELIQAKLFLNEEKKPTEARQSPVKNIFKSVKLISSLLSKIKFKCELVCRGVGRYFTDCIMRTFHKIIILTKK